MITAALPLVTVVYARWAAWWGAAVSRDCPRSGDLLLAVTELAANAIAHSATGQDGSFILSIRTGPGPMRALSLTL